jgi:hypothetical protein
LGFNQAVCSASKRCDDIWQTLGEGLPGTGRIITEEAANVEMELNREAATGQISRLSRVSTMDANGFLAAIRTN